MATSQVMPLPEITVTCEKMENNPEPEQPVSGLARSSEPVPPEGSQPPDPKVPPEQPQPFVAKERFQGAVYKVIYQLLDKKYTIQENDVDADLPPPAQEVPSPVKDKPSPSKGRSGKVATGKQEKASVAGKESTAAMKSQTNSKRGRRRYSTTSHDRSTPKLTKASTSKIHTDSSSSIATHRSGKSDNFASLVRLAKVKQMTEKRDIVRSASKTRADKEMEEEKEKNKEVEEPKEILPTRPRFSATLSPEAQYAMLVSYQEMLHQNLTSSYPECQRMLDRPRTPAARRISLYLPAKDTQKEQKKRKDFNYRCRYDGPVYCSRPQLLSVSPDKLPSVPREKQLRLTHRFQRAMDILDTVRYEQGYIVTSPRLNKCRINPVKTYRAWATEWKTEFVDTKEVKPNKPKTKRSVTAR